MSEPYTYFADRLAAEGFREVQSGCFVSSLSQRVVGLALCRAAPESWTEKIEGLLRKEPFRRALSWARYLVLLVDSPKTPSLA